MGVIPTLLNMYARNKRYQQQRNVYMQDKEERRQDRLRQQALQTFQQQQQQSTRVFGDTSGGYDPFKTLNTHFPE